MSTGDDSSRTVGSRIVGVIGRVSSVKEELLNPYAPTFAEVLYDLVMPAFIFGVFVFLAVFFAILLAGRGLMPCRKLGSGPSGALSIVQERYARGELSRQEFEQMRSVLEG